MNKTKLAVFCALIVAIMCQMDVEADGGRRQQGQGKQTAQSGQQREGRRGRGERGWQGRRGERGWRGKQQEGQRRQKCSGGTCAKQGLAKTETATQASE